MKLYASQLLALLLPITAAFAQDGVLHLSTRRTGSPGEALLARRSSDNALNVSLKNEINSYMATVSVGSPAQKLEVILDTGSSDLWLPSNSACSGDKCPSGSFNPSDSSSYTVTGKGDFNITYADNSATTGDLFTDDLKLGDATLKNFTMALGTDVQKQRPIQGVFGIGYPSNEAVDGKPYANLPQALVDEGVIKSPAYSLWLDDLNTNTGSILFGGVDTSKYTGNLHAIDMEENSNSISIPIKSISLDDKDTMGSTSSVALVDSGTTDTIVPQDVFNTIASKFNADTQLGTLACSEKKKDHHFTFSFDQVDIKVNLSEFVIPMSGTSDRCAFGFQANSGNSYVLGDTFLRSTYAVFDLQNNQVALAQASFNPASAHVVPFKSFGDKIPTASGTGKSGSSSSSSHKSAAAAPLSPDVPGRLLAGSVLSLVVSVLLVSVF